MNANFNFPAQFLGTNSSSLFKDISTRSFQSIKLGESSAKLLKGANNVFIGYYAGFNAIDINDSVFIGAFAGLNNINGYANTLIGCNCGKNIINASNNTITGYNAGSNIINGNNNTIFGYNAGKNISSGNNNAIMGDNTGNGVNNSSFNVIFGNNSGNEIEYGDYNVLIGNILDIIKKDVNNAIIIGNKSSCFNNSVVVGNNINANTTNNISIGSIMNINSVSLLLDPINRNDPIINTSAINRFPLFESIISEPFDTNNLIYKPLNEQLEPYKNSLVNNVTSNIYNINIEEYTIISDKTTNVKEFIRGTYIIDKNNAVFQIPSMLILPLERYRDVLNLSTLNISTKDIPYKFYILNKPRFGSLDNNNSIKNSSDILYINEYPETILEQIDTINITTLIDGVINKDNIVISLNRNSYNTLSYSKEFIRPLNKRIKLYSNFFPNARVYTITDIKSLQIYENNLLQFTNSLYPNNIELLEIVGDGTLNINNINISFKSLETYVESIYPIEFIFISITEPYRLQHNIDELDTTLIYVEIPPKYGYFNLRDAFTVAQLSQLIYMPKKSGIYDNDTCNIRFIKDNKISDKTFLVNIKNYIARLYDLLDNSIILPISESLKKDGYYWENNELRHPNKPILARYIPKDSFPDVLTTITVKKNKIDLDLFPFSSINLKNNLLEITNYSKEPIFNIIEKPSNGYIDNNLIYYNLRNKNDSFKILPTYSNKDGLINNVITVFLNIINNYEITVIDEYIYNNEFKISTISTNKTDNIYITYEGITRHIKDYNFYQDDREVLRDFRLTFEQGDNILDIFPIIPHRTFKDVFIYKLNLANNIYNINKVSYNFKDYINNNFLIKHTITPSVVFDISFNIFRYHIYLSGQHIEISNNEIAIDGNKYEIDILLNNNTIISIDNESINILSNNIETVIGYNINNFSNIEFVYILDENIFTSNTDEYDIENYGVTLNIKNLELSISTDNIDSYNLSLGNNIIISGINNICLGKNFNTFGNNSIVIGSDIGTKDKDLFDAGLHESIILGNGSFKNSLVKNTISIGNNMMNDLNIISKEDYDIASDFFRRNPILIGNNIGYNSNHIINIGNTFKELSTSIEIGKDNKDINLKGRLINDTITDILTRLSVIENKIV